MVRTYISIVTGDNRRVRWIRWPIQRVPGSEATRINIKYIGMHKQHTGIVFQGGKKRTRCVENSLIRITQQGATAFLWTRQGAAEKLVDATDQAGHASNDL